MEGLKIQYTVVLVFVIVMCASSITVADSECCIDCRNVCCGQGAPPSLTCWNVCIRGCPDASTCPCLIGTCPSQIIYMLISHVILFERNH